MNCYQDAHSLGISVDAADFLIMTGVPGLGQDWLLKKSLFCPCISDSGGLVST